MAEKFVLDNSVVMAWCFDDESSQYADAVLKSLLNGSAVAPGVWPLELANALLVAMRRKRISRADAARFLEMIRMLPIEVELELPMRIFKDVFSLANECGISAYDASYLDLAMRKGVALATQDDSLLKAAKHVKVEILEV